jgi:hypothetical protein
MFKILNIQVRIFIPVFQYRFFGVVTGAIIYNDDFFFNAVDEGYRFYPVQYMMNGRALVVGRNDDGKLLNGIHGKIGLKERNKHPVFGERRFKNCFNRLKPSVCLAFLEINQNGVLVNQGSEFNPFCDFDKT